MTSTSPPRPPPLTCEDIPGMPPLSPLPPLSPRFLPLFPPPSATMEWAEQHFTAFPNCFFQLCRDEVKTNEGGTAVHRTCCINVYGEVLLLCDSNETMTERRLQLKDLLPQSMSDSVHSTLSQLTLHTSGSKKSLTQSLSGGSTASFHPKQTVQEIVAVDAMEEDRELLPGHILVISCWGETCELGTTSKYQLVLFRIEMHTGRASLLAREELSKPTALVRFHRYRKRRGLGVLMIPTADRAVIYQITTTDSGDQQQHRLQLSDDCCSELPELTLQPMPGTVVRMASEKIGRSRWTLVGCDNGHLRLWRTRLQLQPQSEKEAEAVMDKAELVKSMKFFGAISVVDIYSPYDEAGQGGDDCAHIVCSSTLGPAAIYRARSKSAPGKIDWRLRVVLGNSTNKDAVTCSARRGDYLCIGFYSQKMCTYNLRRVLDAPEGTELRSLTIATVNAPTAAIQFTGDFELSLITFSGHHSLISYADFVESADDGEEEEIDDYDDDDEEEGEDAFDEELSQEY